MKKSYGFKDLIRTVKVFIILMLIFVPMQCSFAEFKRQMESFALKISKALEQHYQEWCQNGEALCETLTANSCIGVQEKTCDLGFPKPAICMTEGYLNSNTSNIKFTPDVDYDKLTAEQIRFVCSSAKLDTFFHQIKNLNKKITAMYVGSNNGIFREFPGNYHGNQKHECDDYDPRYRPWYTIAASGAKNVIILLDKSSSMQSSGKLQIAKSAVLSVIDSLSISDNVGVIAFENYTEEIGWSQLTKMTSQNKERLQEKVKLVKSNNGETNFEVAFKRGLDMIKQAIQSGDSGCSQAENVFLLLTDGIPTQDTLEADSLVKMIRKQISKDSQIKREIIIFAYALGQNVNKEYLKTLTCNFRGIVMLESQYQKQQKTSSSFATILREFYTYLSVGVKFVSPVWTEPYTDYYGYGRMVTVSMPAYYVDPSTNLSTMIGVTGVDIMMSQFDKYGFTEQEVVNQLIGESACQKNELTDCQLQALRTQQYRCNVSDCVIQQKDSHFCSKIPQVSKIYKKVSLYKQDDKCCGLTITQFTIAVSVSSSMALILFLLFLFRKKIYTKCCDRSYRRLRKSSRKESNVQSFRADSAKRKLSGDQSHSATHLRNLST